MDRIDLPGLFTELQPVRVLVTQGGSVKLSLSGSAIMTREPYLELTFPAEEWLELEGIDPDSQLQLCLETEESVFFVNTAIALSPGEGRFLLRAEDYVQERQKRSAMRVKAERIDVRFWHLDEEGRRTSEEKEAIPLDISSTGIRMRLDQVVEPCQTIGMKLTIHDASQTTIACTAQIVRMALKSDSSIEIAVRFEDIDARDRQRITDFCHGENAVSGEP
jgi:hypothetical protein